MAKRLLRGPLTPYRRLAVGLFIAVLGTAFATLVAFHNSFLVTVPASGGGLTEGIIGAPKTLNPVLAVTDTDIALSHLVYAGLMKETAEGELVPELLESYTLSPDSRTYTITLKKSTFHDGKPVTSNDVLLTVSKLQNSALNPSHTEYWSAVAVETPDDSTVVFTLPAPRGDFLKRLTIGILPAHIWTDIPDESFADARANKRAVGAGPFRLARTESKNGILKSLTFKRNPRYVTGAPLLKTLTVEVYSNQDELMKGVVNGDVDLTMALLPTTLPSDTVDTYSIASIATSTSTGLYQLRGTGGALSNAAFVTVLNEYIDKEKIIDIVENGYGTPLDTADSVGYTALEAQDHLERLGYRTSNNGALTRNGASVGFSIATINTPSNIALANEIAEQARALGITVSVRSFDPGFFQSALASGAFTTILVKGPVPKAQYEAVLPLYTTHTPFVTNSEAHGIIPPVLISPVLRYANVQDWYTNTDRLYPVLAPKREKTNY